MSLTPRLSPRHASHRSGRHSYDRNFILARNLLVLSTLIDFPHDNESMRRVVDSPSASMSGY